MKLTQPFEPKGDQCPACGRSELRSHDVIAHDKGLDARAMSVTECLQCEFAWQWPLHRTAEYSVAYFEKNYAKQEPGTYFDPNKKRNTCEMEFAFFDEHFDSPSLLLDVGCGDATFCKLASEHGWKAVGLDPAAEASQQNLEGNAVEVFKGTLDTFQYGEKFDAVTMWDVVEHVDDPLHLIRSAKSHLKKGGLLFIETGNYQSADRIEGGENWWCYQHDHRWYFSPPVLMKLLTEAGFDDFRVCSRVLRPWVNRERQYKGPSLVNHVKRSIKNPALSAKMWRRYVGLKKAAEKWPEWSGLTIFTLSARSRS